VSASPHIIATNRSDSGFRAGDCADPVGGVFDHVNRWGGGGFCYVQHSPQGCTHPVGAGSYVAERGGAALSAGADGKAANHPHHLAPRRRCAVGDGGRITLCRTGGGDWRGVGGTTQLGFHGNQTVGDTGRGQQSGLLADPPGGCARPECGTQPLARGIPAVTGTSARPPRTWRSALAGGVVPRASGATGHMGGAL
jgi:hypothetical protein